MLKDSRRQGFKAPGQQIKDSRIQGVRDSKPQANKSRIQGFKASGSSKRHANKSRIHGFKRSRTCERAVRNHHASQLRAFHGRLIEPIYPKRLERSADNVNELKFLQAASVESESQPPVSTGGISQPKQPAASFGISQPGICQSGLCARPTFPTPICMGPGVPFLGILRKH